MNSSLPSQVITPPSLNRQQLDANPSLPLELHDSSSSPVIFSVLSSAPKRAKVAVLKIRGPETSWLEGEVASYHQEISEHNLNPVDRVRTSRAGAAGIFCARVPTSKELLNNISVRFEETFGVDRAGICNERRMVQLLASPSEDGQPSRLGSSYIGEQLHPPPGRAPSVHRYAY